MASRGGGRAEDATMARGQRLGSAAGPPRCGIAHRPVRRAQAACTRRPNDRPRSSIPMGRRSGRGGPHQPLAQERRATAAGCACQIPQPTTRPAAGRRRSRRRARASASPPSWPQRRSQTGRAKDRAVFLATAKRYLLPHRRRPRSPDFATWASPRRAGRGRSNRALNRIGSQREMQHLDAGFVDVWFGAPPPSHTIALRTHAPHISDRRTNRTLSLALSLIATALLPLLLPTLQRVKQLYNLLVTLLLRQHQGRIAMLISQLDVRVPPNQQLRHVVKAS